jgi:hypothetical protein
VIAQTCRRHHDADTQEHQFSSRIAQALEHELNNVSVSGMQVQITVQELPDRGRGSKEKAVGADLYVSIVIKEGDETESKGMLVQSKWESTITEDRSLRRQTEDMLRRSRDSYIWAYGPQGISVFPAHAEGLAAAASGDGGTTVGKLLTAGIACTAGDKGIGRDPDKPLVESLNAQLRELAVGTALSIVAIRP